MFDIAEGPINRRMYLQAGRPDFSNRYATTVMVTSKDPLEGAECSGLLVSPRVVLTAASCVCGNPNGPACAEHAYASTIIYKEVIREDLADFRVRTYRGVVSPHPEFRLLRDGDGGVVSSQADLAMIVLEEPVELEFARHQLREEESKPGELLHMAGYGYGTQWGQLYGMRFVRRDKVTRTATSGGGRVVYEQQGAFLYNGFHGGPCFHEDEGGRWLAGIVSVGAGRELAFTSLYPYQDWLKAGIQRARGEQ
ncbi:MAG: trypsin-like serine protease [Myxococcaceae bacterium]|nr:trypsin-like serine protease [Myxococcaceae bacterium]